MGLTCRREGVAAAGKDDDDDEAAVLVMVVMACCGSVVGMEMKLGGWAAGEEQDDGVGDDELDCPPVLCLWCKGRDKMSASGLVDKNAHAVHVDGDQQNVWLGGLGMCVYVCDEAGLKQQREQRSSSHLALAIVQAKWPSFHAHSRFSHRPTTTVTTQTSHARRRAHRSGPCGGLQPTKASLLCPSSATCLWNRGKS